MIELSSLLLFYSLESDLKNFRNRLNATALTSRVVRKLLPKCGKGSSSGKKEEVFC